MTPEMNQIMGSVYYRPAVSIILPFEPKMSLKTELSHSLKLASDKVEIELKEDYPAEMVELMMAKLRKLVAGLNYSTHKKSIAVYLSPVFEKVLYLDIPVHEKIIIDDSFEIRDIVYNKKQLREYLVLILSGKSTKMFLGNSQKLVKIVANSTRSVHTYINDVPQKVANFSDPSSRKEIIMEKFLRHIDNELDIILYAYKLPLFVMGTERISGHFRKLTRHSKSIIEYVHGNYEAASTHELADVLKPYTELWEKILEKSLLNQLEDALGKGKLSIGMRDVWKEAMNHRGRLLVVEKDYMYTAQRGDSKGTIFMPRKPYNKFSIIKDAVDDVIQAVLENGGDVEFVDNGMLKEYHHIALIKY